ncbi:MAG: hypothetical protein M4579_005692 [Chaenotheca gracillima]|nr:MAG: hypothetical protein M4579_005692 [Chaenotheca gracillima]
MDQPVKNEIEELEDDTSPDRKLSSTPAAEGFNDGDDQAPSSSSGPQAAGKRPRGRPRKHPLPSTEPQSKIAKGRSKTGCITCRRRKKKCDETKPQCQNCRKNAVVCEGYPERVFWKSGREKAEAARQARAGTQPRELPTLVDGVENEIDRILLDHFVYKLSDRLTVNSGLPNRFPQSLLTMALHHKGLMHSLLCLSGHHLAEQDPRAFSERREYHYSLALRELASDNRMDERIFPRSAELIDDPSVAQMLTSCLHSIHRGENKGEYRPHSDVGRLQALHHSSPSSEFRQYLYEFFNYRETVGSVNPLEGRSLKNYDDFKLPFVLQHAAGLLLGVCDQLFGLISKITRIRDIIRIRKHQGIDPLVDYPMLSEAVSLDSTIRAWVTPRTEEPNKIIASQLYRQCTWIYLYRTIQPSRPTAKLSDAVEEGLSYLRQLPPEQETHGLVLLPLFLLGCAAFNVEQRPDIRRTFGMLKRYTNSTNIDIAREVVDRVWARMDASDESSWDWETITQDMGFDTLLTWESYPPPPRSQS